MNFFELKKEVIELGITDFYRVARNYFLEKEGFDKEPINNPEKKEDLENLISKTAKSLKVEKENLWKNHSFHMLFRITNLEELINLIEGRVNKKELSNNKNKRTNKKTNTIVDLEKIKESLNKGREMSILPLNALLGYPLIKKYLPEVPRLYSGEKEHSLDPYGIFGKKEQIKIIINGEPRYVGSRKFDYAVLENITEFCPVGCAGCYKGTLTRMTLSALAEISPKYAKLKQELNFQEKRAIEQTELLIKWLNKRPEVNTVIISGGEPLMYSTKTIKEILDTLSRAEHIKAVRICTSAVYQGLFYKINDELIEAIKEFKRKNNGRKGRSKKELYFNCHVTDENQLLTPEAMIATERLREAGVSIHLQMPLQEGINFYRNDLERSAKKLIRISKAAYEMGVIPYKIIVDMHSPSYPELTAPIEKVSEVITVMDNHFNNSDMNRWQAYNILHEEGNLYLYPEPHFIADKEIDKERKRVTYFIPKVNPDGSINQIHTYEEPLLEGINDQNTLRPIMNKKIQEEINKVKEAYKRLRKGDIKTEDFFRISGIKFSTNQPLIIN